MGMSASQQEIYDTAKEVLETLLSLMGLSGTVIFRSSRKSLTTPAWSGTVAHSIP